MFNFPYFGFPYNNPYYRFYNRPNNYVNIQKNITNGSNSEEIDVKNSSTENFSDKNLSEKLYRENENVQRGKFSLDNNNDKDTPIFEIFGIKLFSDDLIILAVLFLLYEQNVKDEMLYIILFLLLFS